MDTIRSWLKGKQDSPQLMEGKDANEITTNSSGRHHIEEGQGHLKVDSASDPKVVEYFKDFPEPYKTKAIARFSSREGFYRWDFVRDFAMQWEYESASRGEFLEDKREAYNKLIEHEQSYREVREKEKKDEIVEHREQSALEKAIRSRIPVHEDESLGLKLAQTANFSFLGFLLVWSAVKLKKRRPMVPTWQRYMAIGGSSYIFIYLHVAAVYRMMDWGPFDRSVDNRDALTKQIDEIKQFFTSLVNETSQKKGKDGS